MKGFFVTVLLASVSAAMLNLLADGYEKQFRFVASAVCIAIVLIPLTRIELPELSAEYTESEASAENTELMYLTGELAEERTEQYISESVFSEFGIKPQEVYIDIDWMSAEPVIKSIVITLPKCGKSAEIGAYLKNTLGGEVQINEE